MIIDPSKLSIFVVDDDEYCTQMYQQHLHNLGFKNVLTFTSGEECIQNLGQKPEIIFLDHIMNPDSGLVVLQKIKAINPNIYVVILSSQKTIEVAIESLKLGAFDYIIKGNNDSKKITEVMNKLVPLIAV